ncbi:MAG: cupin domain-containing protein [Nonlabens sp.]|uniref:cupin domain-containing protein n=1 Tax=Nonlabens sp. TaxID=1888209 RepID=UPI003EF670A0
MKIESFHNDLNYNDDRIVTKVLLETSFSKEIRILLKQGQLMKEHKAPFPIIVHILEGKIDFGVEGGIHSLKKGDIITLDALVPHDLKALEDSVVRLTLSKLDQADRVEQVIKE